MLQIRNFIKRYSGNTVLAIQRLDLNPGIYWIKGDNGSGKTSLFKSLAGIIPSEGDVLFHPGPHLHRQPVSFRRLVNYAEAEPLFPGFLTAKDLIYFTARSKNFPVSDALAIAKKLGVDVFLDSPCETFSSGMMKKLSLVLVFLGTPRLILLDEPFITLDEQARYSLYELIQQSFQSPDTVILISSHQDIDTTMLPIKATYRIHHQILEP